MKMIALSPKRGRARLLVAEMLQNCYKFYKNIIKSSVKVTFLLHFYKSIKNCLTKKFFYGIIFIENQKRFFIINKLKRRKTNEENFY